MIGLAVLSYSMDEIMKLYGGVFLNSNPLGSYEQSKFSQLVAKLDHTLVYGVPEWVIEHYAAYQG